MKVEDAKRLLVDTATEALAELIAEQLVVERDPDDPSRVNVYYPAWLLRRLGMKPIDDAPPLVDTCETCVDWFVSPFPPHCDAHISERHGKSTVCALYRRRR